jgi:diguanylate cyclase (GGDEF)-like protein
MTSDARLNEFLFLATLDRSPIVSRRYASPLDPERHMVVSLLMAGCLNGPDVMPLREPYQTQTIIDGLSPIERQIVVERGRDMNGILSGQDVMIRINHAGRLRLARLRDELRSGRERDATGIVVDGRYVQRDLKIALADVSEAAPVTVAFADMNGLKRLNDRHGHAVGTEAIRAYLETVSVMVGNAGTVYRRGGDEVVVIFPAQPIEAAVKVMVAALRDLGHVRLAGIPEVDRPIAAVCGLAATTNPTADAAALEHEADQRMYRAKEYSKQNAGCSAIAADGAEVRQVT